MRITVVFDKTAVNTDLRVGWGVSFLIDGHILFDTGEKGPWLLENLRILGVDPREVDAAAISHDHWDHWGGLWDLMEKRKALKVYTCPGAGEEFKKKVCRLQGELIEVPGLTEIAKNVYLTGEVRGMYHGYPMFEQAMVLKTGKGLCVLTGCAHPGILKMIEAARQAFPSDPLYLVVGGFHLIESDKRTIEDVASAFRKMGVQKAGPTHCSGDAAEEIFRRHFDADYVAVNAGQNIEV